MRQEGVSSRAWTQTGQGPREGLWGGPGEGWREGLWGGPEEDPEGGGSGVAQVRGLRDGLKDIHLLVQGRNESQSSAKIPGIEKV